MKNKKSSDSRQSNRLKIPTNLLLQLLTDLSSVGEARSFFQDFFTNSERQMFAKRLAILFALKEGKSYEEIRKLYGVSSATISSVAETMSNKGMQLIIQKIETDQWADAWAERIMKIFGWGKR